MKFVYTFVAFALLALTLPSCKNCTECTKGPGNTEKLCKKDFASEESYTQAYQQLIGQGYKCD